MKEITFKLFVTNVLEQLTGLTLVNDDIDLHVSGLRLVAGEDVAMPVFPKEQKGKVQLLKLASLFEDNSILEDLSANLLIKAPEGLMFIGDPELAIGLAESLKAGRVGIVASPLGTDAKSRRAFWVTERVDLLNKALKRLDPDAKADAAAAEAPTGESPDRKPAKKPSEGGKPKGGKPAEAKPAEGAEPKKANPAGEGAEDAADASKPVRLLSLVELANGMIPGDNAGEEDGETAEQECIRLCRQEGVVFDAALESEAAADDEHSEA